MVVIEFEEDDVFSELNRKFANVSIDQPSIDYVYTEIMSDDLYEYRNDLEFSTNYNNRFRAMKSIRRYLTQNISSFRIQHIFELGIEDNIRKILEAPGGEELKYEAAWTVTNLAFGTKEQTARLIQTGVIESLIRCIRTVQNSKIKSQCAWALANVSMDSPSYRESMAKAQMIGLVADALIEKCDVLEYMSGSTICHDKFYYDEMGQLSCQKKSDFDDIKELTWSLANLCRGGFRTSDYMNQYLTAFKAFTFCIQFRYEEVWSEACWGLSRVLSNMYDNMEFFHRLKLDSRVCPRIVYLLSCESLASILPVLQTISNFSSAPNEYMEILLDANLLNHLSPYLSPNTHPILRRNAALTISNLAAGNQKIVRKVVYHTNIINSVIAHLIVPGNIFDIVERQWSASALAILPATVNEWKILKESLWVLSNITTLADDDCICVLLRNHTDMIKQLCRLFYFPQLPLEICLKVVDILTRIVDRTNLIGELTPPVKPFPRNPYAEEMIAEGVMPALSHLNRELQSPELSENSGLLFNAVALSHPSFQSSSASVFGLQRNGMKLPEPNIRRIVHGFEDGDVSSIERAFNKIQL